MLHEVRDPVHGFILYDDLERDLVNSRPFQRLRRIKQLALTYLVYPGAVHTRFEHSLGVMEAASQLFDTLTRKGHYDLLQALGISSEGERERVRRVLRIAALLHDLGHPPFSHAPGGSEEHLQQVSEVMSGGDSTNEHHSESRKKARSSRTGSPTQ